VRCLSACNPRRGTTSTLPFCCESELTLLCAAARACSVPSPFSSFCRENFGLAVGSALSHSSAMGSLCPGALLRYLAVWPIFRFFGEPPLFILWPAIHNRREKRILWSKLVECDVGSPPVSTMLLAPKVFRDAPSV
jgi:hypothetical protein